MNRSWIVDSLVVVALTVLLIAPLFDLNWMDNWSSIESTFISDARMLRDWGFQPQWQPLWYCGTRWDYVYPPALRYGTAALSYLFKGKTTRGYHVYTALTYTLGIWGVYFLVRMGSGSRRWALLGAAAAALVSPSYLLIDRIRVDVAGAYLLPMRLNVLVRYGEGPHMGAWAWIPVALGLAWRGLRPGANTFLAASAVACAMVVANNFYGGTALALLFPVLVWSLWAAYREPAIWYRAALAAILACGLCAFWLTPSYLTVTLRNMRYVSTPGNDWSGWVVAGVAAAFGWAALRWGKGRPWPVFVLGAAVTLTLNVLGNEYFGLRVIGEPTRLIPELDVCLILLVLLGASMIPRHGWATAGVAALTVIAGWRYATHAWKVFPKAQDYTQRVEYRMTKWMHENLPEVRSVTTGSVRFWYNAWYDLAQLGGGSDQGVINPNTMAALWPITADKSPHAVAWAKAMGVGALLSHDKHSEEMYHDWAFPRRFDGELPVVFDDGKGNVVYRVPRVHEERARVVVADKLNAVPKLEEVPSAENVTRYAEVVETGPRVEYRRVSPEEMVLRTTVQAGETLLVQETYDQSWKAYQGGQSLAVRPDPAGFMQVAVPAGTGEVRLVFEKPLENRVGGGVTWLAVAGVVLLARWKR